MTTIICRRLEAAKVLWHFSCRGGIGSVLTTKRCRASYARCRYYARLPPFAIFILALLFAFHVLARDDMPLRSLRAFTTGEEGPGRHYDAWLARAARFRRITGFSRRASHAAVIRDSVVALIMKLSPQNAFSSLRKRARGAQRRRKSLATA